MGLFLDMEFLNETIGDLVAFPLLAPAAKDPGRSPHSDKSQGLQV